MKYLSIIFILFFSLNCFAQADTTAPDISSFGYFPPAINVGSGSDNLSISIRATDDISGVNIIRLRFRSPSGNQTIDADLNNQSLVSGNNKNGLYNKTVTFTKGIETGGWLVDYIYLRDEAGNERYIYTSELTTRGYRTRLPIVDIICTYTLNPASQDFPASGGSGIATVTTQTGCTGSVISNSSFISANSIGATANLGTGVLTFTVPFSVEVNTGAAPRTGTLIISGQMFIVNQAGAAKSRKRVRFF